MSSDVLISNITRIHTTEMGKDRIAANLKLDLDDVVDYCKSKILDVRCEIHKRGKNWYCRIDGIEITVNAHSYTIITAHLVRDK